MSDLTLDEKAIRWGIVAELYYTSKDNQSLNYSVMVNSRTKQVVGFTKDVMAMLSYFSGSKGRPAEPMPAAAAAGIFVLI